MKLRIAALPVVLTTFILGACAGPPVDDDEDTAGSADAVIGGTETFANPAVGVTTLDGATGCSATLVATNVILTAAHCFEPNRSDVGPWQFEIRRSDTERYRYDTAEGFVNSRKGAGSDDVALLRLKQRVPAAVARPIPIARSWPSYGTTVSLVGFGCTNRTTGEGAGTKRSLSFRYTAAWSVGWVSSGTCPGDSGGGLLAAKASGPEVVGVLSGYQGAPGLDLFGDAVKHRAKLLAQISAWQ